MVYTEYNLREALASLMGKHGRHLHMGRREGFDQMVRTLGESLDLDSRLARHLVDSLVSSGLVCFEGSEEDRGRPPATYQPSLTRSARPRKGRQRPPAPQERGVWRLGPCA